MTVPASEEFRVEATLDLWTVIPDPQPGLDLSEWASGQTERWREATGADEAAGGRVRAFLTALVDDVRPGAYPWRVVFLVDPDHGAAVFDLTLLDQDPALPLTQLVDGDIEAELGSDTRTFALNGIEGVRSVRFNTDDPAAKAERVIRAQASAAVSREVPPWGVCTVLARAESVHLEALAIAMQPLEHLLTCDELLALISGGAH